MYLLNILNKETIGNITTIETSNYISVESWKLEDRVIITNE